MSIVSNGCVGTGLIETFEGLFNFSIFSFVGFQPVTYKRIMGLDLNRTRRFVEELIRRKKVEVEIKFLCAPNNIHEVPLLLEWGFEKLPNSILLMEMGGFNSYINRNTWDSYWDKIFKRTGNEIRELLVRSKDSLEEKQLLKLCLGGWMKQQNYVKKNFV